MNPTQVFGELRSATQAQPSVKSWRAICKAIHKWRDRDSFIEQALPYLSEALSAWPSTIHREADRRWVSEPLHPALSLANSLKLRGAQESDEALARIVSAPELTGLLTLDLSETSADLLTLTALAESPHLTSLTTLLLERSRASPEAFEALGRSRRLDALRTINVSYTPSLVQLEPLLDSGLVVGLERLDMYGVRAPSPDDLIQMTDTVLENVGTLAQTRLSASNVEFVERAKRLYQDLDDQIALWQWFEYEDDDDEEY
jgi:hypothetical protein